ncbi:hypothetical protein ACFSL4_05575 [Streptomyces caeni]|uniref:DUF3592 domain-containing protein n=1 Tax=Streptomyces caeni TaxID=2307231 RepID=A0ABW4IML4_9ACTN
MRRPASVTAFRGPAVWLWRWRRNPLRRGSDVLEAWLVLAVWVLIVVGGVLTGLAATHAVERGMARERAEWRPVVALLSQDAPRAAAARVSRPARVWAKVRWTGTDGSPHSGLARVAAGSPTGTAVTVWTDRDGSVVSRPATASEARTRAAAVGALAGVGVGVVPFTSGRIIRGCLERRRMAQWDEAWARFGRTWGHKTG